MTLLYPEWIPGNTRRAAQLDKLAGLVIRAGGKVIPWTRDPVDVFAFHVDVPAGRDGARRRVPVPVRRPPPTRAGW